MTNKNLRKTLFSSKEENKETELTFIDLLLCALHFKISLSFTIC